VATTASVTRRTSKAMPDALASGAPRPSPFV
jgi:hypothetical protein